MSLYDIQKSFEENVTYGPYWSEKLPKSSKAGKKYTFLGKKVNSLFGVAACPLTVNSRSIELLSRLGYDIITYKSVRSRQWQGNVFPHWMYVDIQKQLPSSYSEQSVKASFEAFGSQDVSMANSFGIHSIKPEYWQKDVNDTVDILGDGQVLILSLMPTPTEGKTLVDDARLLAQLAAETAAPVFEMNFACPNTDGGKGLIYEDIDLTYRISVAMKKKLGKRPLLAKVGHYHSEESLRAFLVKMRGVIDGIATMNTLVMGVTDAKGDGVFPGRAKAGISGAAIRTIAMNQAKRIVELKKELGMKKFAVIGIGGVTKPTHVRDYLAVGVDAVQTAVGAYADPLLANKYRKIS